jgi:hypothetical protein
VQQQNFMRYFFLAGIGSEYVTISSIWNLDQIWIYELMMKIISGRRASAADY